MFIRKRDEEVGMKLKAFQKKYLKSLAHKMKANVIIGKNGLTKEIINKVDQDLDEHELLKIKVLESDIIPIKEAVTKISSETSSEVVKVVGKTAVIYRENKDNKKPYFKACGAFGSKVKLEKRDRSGNVTDLLL